LYPLKNGGRKDGTFKVGFQSGFLRGYRFKVSSFLYPKVGKQKSNPFD
jgi:hypothetical protein